MHRTYAKDGLAALSVSLDDPHDKGVCERVLKFLQAKNATFTNLILDEGPEVWQEKLKFTGPPCVFVFDRQGKLVKQFKDEFTYVEVEKLVKELLGKS
jgi:hypothetical protein